jgi:hypothetical protein
MFLQGIIVFALCSIVLFLGLKEKKTDFNVYTADIKLAAKEYINDNYIKPKISKSYIVKIEDLINGRYIEEDEKLKEYCIIGVVYTNNLIKDTYSVQQNCDEFKDQEREE